jgi:DNA-binding MarR family transcriptional regulator
MMNETEKVTTIIKDWMESLTMRTMDTMRHHVKSTGLSMPQFSLLMRLYHGGSCGLQDVSRHFDVTGAAASQLVEKLVHAGYVVRSENPDDRRAREIALSPKGTALIEKSIEERFRWVSDMVAHLNAEERAAVLASLPILIAAEKRLPATVHNRGVPAQ